MYEWLTFTEMKNTIDLIMLYLDINEKVMETKGMPKSFKKFTTNLRLIQKQLDKIKIEKAPQPMGVKNVTPVLSPNNKEQTLWQHFTQLTQNVGLSKTFATLKSGHPLSSTHSMITQQTPEFPLIQNT